MYPPPHDYIVKLTFNQIVALVDIAENYLGEDSPRCDGRTIAALDRRELIMHDGAKLTAKGDAYLSMAITEEKFRSLCR
jgi:hypothetical protein